MIYLIGGSPRCGKTTLAQTLAKAKGISYVPVDYLMSALFPYIHDNEWDTMFPLRNYREETNWSNDALYAKYAPQEIVQSYLTEAESTWPGVKNFIAYALTEKRDFILEGFQLLPHLVNTFNTPENQGQIQTLFLYKTDVNAILAGMKANTQENDWALKNTTEEKALVAIAQMVSLFGAHIQKESAQYGLQAVSMDGDFLRTMSELVASLT